MAENFQTAPSEDAVSDKSSSASLIDKGGHTSPTPVKNGIHRAENHHIGDSKYTDNGKRGAAAFDEDLTQQSADDSEEPVLYTGLDFNLTQAAEEPMNPIITAQSEGVGNPFEIEYRKGAVYLIGRDPEDDPSSDFGMDVSLVTISDPGRGTEESGKQHIVSRNHALVECKTSGLMITCLGTNGIGIAREGRSHFLLKPAREGVEGKSKVGLENGDVVQFGYGASGGPYTELAYKMVFPAEPVGTGRRSDRRCARAAALATVSAAAANDESEEEAAAVDRRDPAVVELTAAIAARLRKEADSMESMRTQRGVFASAGRIANDLRGDIPKESAAHLRERKAARAGAKKVSKAAQVETGNERRRAAPAGAAAAALRVGGARSQSRRFSKEAVKDKRTLERRKQAELHAKSQGKDCKGGGRGDGGKGDSRKGGSRKGGKAGFGKGGGGKGGFGKGGFGKGGFGKGGFGKGSSRKGGGYSRYSGGDSGGGGDSGSGGGGSNGGDGGSGGGDGSAGGSGNFRGGKPKGKHGRQQERHVEFTMTVGEERPLKRLRGENE